MTRVIACLIVLGLAGCVDLPKFQLEREASEQRWRTTRADVKARLAAAELEAGNLDGAGREVARARELDPDNARLRLLDAQIRVNSGRPAEAAELLEPLVTDDALGGQALYLLGVIAQQLADWATAAEYFDAALARSPGDLALFIAAVESDLQIGRAASAATRVAAGQATFATQPAYHACAAEVYERNGNWPAATEAWQRVVDAADDPAARRRLADAAFRAGRWAQALEAMPPAVGDQPDAETDYRRAVCHLRLGAHEPARRAAIAALRSDPEHLPATRLLLELLLERREYAAARELASTTVRRQGLRDPDLVAASLVLESRYGDRKAAKQLAEQLLRGDVTELRTLAEIVLRELDDAN